MTQPWNRSENVLKSEGYETIAVRGPISDFEDLFGNDRRGVARGTLLRREGDESHARFYVAEGWLAVSKLLEDGDHQILDFTNTAPLFGRRRYRARAASLLRFAKKVKT